MAKEVRRARTAASVGVESGGGWAFEWKGRGLLVFGAAPGFGPRPKILRRASLGFQRHLQLSMESSWKAPRHCLGSNVGENSCLPKQLHQALVTLCSYMLTDSVSAAGSFATRTEG
jgi:hypothetical protein